MSEEVTFPDPPTDDADFTPDLARKIISGCKATVERLMKERNAAEARVDKLEQALRHIIEDCDNHGRPNEIVCDRIIERVEETAVNALAAHTPPGGA